VATRNAVAPCPLLPAGPWRGSSFQSCIPTLASIAGSMTSAHEPPNALPDAFDLSFDCVSGPNGSG
jgi:hypothetical protein